MSTKASNALVAVVDFYSTRVAELERDLAEARNMPKPLAELVGAVAKLRTFAMAYEGGQTQLVGAEPRVDAALKELLDAFDRYTGVAGVEPGKQPAGGGPVHPPNVRRGRAR